MSPPEWQLLLYCATSCPDARRVRDLVGKGINWQRFLTLAANHCVRPTVHQTLKSACWDEVPQTIQRELTTFNKANVHKNIVFTGELLRLLGLFNQDGIAIAAFKGPVIALSLYGDLSLREFSDLDVFIHEADLPKAEEILTAQGYQADYVDRDFRSAFLSYQGQYAFRHPQKGIAFDLHWRLASKGIASPLKDAEIWSKLNDVTVGGQTVRTLAHDDLILFLAAHGAKEGWRSLVWICDFAELLYKFPETDWLRLYDRAERSHSSRSLLSALILAATLLDAPVPSTLLDIASKSSSVGGIVEKAKGRMLRDLPGGEFQEFWDSLNTHDYLRHRVLPVVTLLTTRTVGDYEAMPLPKSLWHLYYLTRPFRLAGKAVNMLAGNMLATDSRKHSLSN